MVRRVLPRHFAAAFSDGISCQCNSHECSVGAHQVASVVPSFHFSDDFLSLISASPLCSFDPELRDELYKLYQTIWGKYTPRCATEQQQYAQFVPTGLVFFMSIIFVRQTECILLRPGVHEHVVENTTYHRTRMARDVCH